MLLLVPSTAFGTISAGESPPLTVVGRAPASPVSLSVWTLTPGVGPGWGDSGLRWKLRVGGLRAALSCSLEGGSLVAERLGKEARAAWPHPPSVAPGGPGGGPRVCWSKQNLLRVGDASQAPSSLE